MAKVQKQCYDHDGIACDKSVKHALIILEITVTFFYDVEEHER